MDYSKTWLYHQTDNRDHFLDAQGRLRYVVKKIRGIPNAKDIVDLGFGDGFLLKELCKLGYQTHGIDFVEKNVEITRQSTGLGNRLKCGSVTSIPFSDKSFDVAVATEMFEHLTESDLEKGLLEIRRILRKNGFLIVSVPYNEDLSKKTVCCPQCGCRFHLWGHQQSFNDGNLDKKFSKHFLIRKIEKVYPMTENLNVFGRFHLLMRKIFRKYKGYFILLQVKK